MNDISQIYDWTQKHEEADEKRFAAIHEKLESLPEDIKAHVNGSVEATVNKQITGMFRWLGLGGFLLLVSIGVAWGVLVNKVDRHEVLLQSTLDAKDLKNVELQLSQQAAAIQGIQNDVTLIKSIWLK